MQLVMDLPPRDEAPATARAAVTALGRLMDPRVLEDLRLVVSELVTNSVRYGPGKPIRLSLDIDPPSNARGEVIDQGSGVVEICDAKHGDGGGHGLRLVDDLTSRWGVHEGSTHVWFELSGSHHPQ